MFLHVGVFGRKIDDLAKGGDAGLDTLLPPISADDKHELYSAPHDPLLEGNGQ